MRKYFSFIFQRLLIILFVTLHASAQPTLGLRIGIVSAFPKAGMFFNNRARKVGFFSRNSLFPTKDTFLSQTNVNEDISSFLANALNQHHGQKQTFLALPTVDIENLTGYFIEGDLGPETKYVTLKNIKSLLKKYHLDTIIAIVPVTYYLPITDSEGSGMNMTIKKDTLYFSATYAVLIFSENGKKTFSSLKQVYLVSKDGHYVFPNNRYDQQTLSAYLDLFKNEFLPHLKKQILLMITSRDERKVFAPPQKPFFYWPK